MVHCFSEMKANMRDLCIPLETYAYDQEFACAVLLGLLEPTLKKNAIRIADISTDDTGTDDGKSVIVADTEDASISESKPAVKGEETPLPHETGPVHSASSMTPAIPVAVKTYGDVISEMVQTLRWACKEDCAVRLRAKIKEKQQQVTARAEAARGLRARAIRAIMKAYVCL